MTNTNSQSQPPDAPEGNHHRWDTIPIPKPVTAPWNLCISQTDSKKMIDGFIPETMEDRWLFYSDAPDPQGLILIHLCRSWSMTEQMVLKLRLAADATGGLEYKDTGSMITEITWAGQQGEGGLGEEEAKDEAMELCNAILGCELPVD